MKLGGSVPKLVNGWLLNLGKTKLEHMIYVKIQNSTCTIALPEVRSSHPWLHMESPGTFKNNHWAPLQTETKSEGEVQALAFLKALLVILTCSHS